MIGLEDRLLLTRCFTILWVKLIYMFMYPTLCARRSMPTDIQVRSQNLCHFDPGMGLKLGVVGFPAIKINIIRQVRITVMYCSLGVKINKLETPECPQFELHGWWGHYTGGGGGGGYTRSGIFLVYLWACHIICIIHQCGNLLLLWGLHYEHTFFPTRSGCI